MTTYKNLRIKKDRAECENYLGISLAAHAGKVLLLKIVAKSATKGALWERFCCKTKPVTFSIISLPIFH